MLQTSVNRIGVSVHTRMYTHTAPSEGPGEAEPSGAEGIGMGQGS